MRDWFERLNQTVPACDRIKYILIQVLENKCLIFVFLVKETEQASAKIILLRFSNLEILLKAHASKVTASIESVGGRN